MKLTATAHIVTSDAHCLGDPEILVFMNDGRGDRLVRRRSVSPADAVDEVVHNLGIDTGWHPVRETLERVETGYAIVNVWRET